MKTRNALCGLTSGLLCRPSGNPGRRRIFRPLLCVLTGTALALTSTASAQEECKLGIVATLGVPGCHLGGNYSTWIQGRVASHGEILYGGKNMQYCGAEMVVLEASDPANPTQVGTFKVPGGWNETHPDGHSNIFEILADPDRMVVYISTSSPWATRANRIYAVDVSDPSNPTEIGRLLCGFTGYGMTLRGDHLFLARGNGLDIINVSDPANMTILGSVAGGGKPRRMTDVAVYGNYAYMSGQTNGYSQGIEVYDISNLVSPQKIPTSIALSYIVYGEYAGESGRIPTYLQIAGDTLYFMQGNNNGPRNLYVLDLANPAVPTVEGTVPGGLNSYVILVKDEMLYTVGDGFLKRLSIGDPRNPVLLDATPSSSLISLSVSSTRAFGAHARNGFFIFDVCSAPHDSPPTADAGTDQSIRAGATVNLDGSASFDDNTASALLDYSWSFSSKPAGSNATLIGANTGTPSFVADVAGSYVVDLVVTDEQGVPSAPSSVIISSDNQAPTAVATVDFGLAIVGTTSNFDGSGSTDPEGDPLTYSWTITTAPAGSTATLGDAGTDSPTLITDVEGTYELTLTVSDFIGAGSPVTLEVVATTPTNYAEIQIVYASDAVESLLTSAVTTRGNQKAFANFLKQATKEIQKGKISNAIGKLNQALERTDGCALRGSPDGNGKGMDWITDCDTQLDVYTLLSSAIDALQQ